ncbi:MAG: hypothetical protein ABIH45_05505, partial [Candidatus Omnitrophota bacterium]
MNSSRIYLPILLILVVLVLSADSAFTQSLKPLVYGTAEGPEEGTTKSVKVVAGKEILKELSRWDKKIWFFTSEKNPIQSLDQLKEGDIAAWGIELAEKVGKFRDLALGIKKGVLGLRMIGTGNPIFNGMADPPRVFITWSGYEPQLKGGIRIEFVDKLEGSEKVKESLKAKEPVESTERQLTGGIQETLLKVGQKVGEKGESNVLAILLQAKVLATSIQIKTMTSSMLGGRFGGNKTEEMKKQLVATVVSFLEQEENLSKAGNDMVELLDSPEESELGIMLQTEVIVDSIIKAAKKINANDKAKEI